MHPLSTLAKVDYRRFVIRRAALRIIPSQYSGCHPKDIHLTVQHRGKPTIDVTASNIEPICFNMSHSAEIAIIAVNSTCSIGVDVEFLQDIPDNSLIWQGYFSVNERAKLANIPIDQLNFEFLKRWTLKEAFAKALGQGLFVPFDTFEIEINPDDTLQLIAGNMPQ